MKKGQYQLTIFDVNKENKPKKKMHRLMWILAFIAVVFIVAYLLFHYGVVGKFNYAVRVDNEGNFDHDSTYSAVVILMYCDVTNESETIQKTKYLVLSYTGGEELENDMEEYKELFLQDASLEGNTENFYYTIEKIYKGIHIGSYVTGYLLGSCNGMFYSYIGSAEKAVQDCQVSEKLDKNWNFYENREAYLKKLGD